MPLNNGFPQEIITELETIRKDETLYLENNFLARSGALDDLELRVTDRLEFFADNQNSANHFEELKRAAEELKFRLEEVDKKMFQKLREGVLRGVYRNQMLINLIDEYLDYQLDAILRDPATGYDELDVFLNGLLGFKTLPAETSIREPGMVYYQKTPARIVFQMITKAAFRPADVFYDLGSGLGQVTILVNLLAGIESKGVEFEPAFYDYARACAAGLNLKRVEFIRADARYADYSKGTVFFLYTPCAGQILENVLEKLLYEAKKRTIRIFTFGSCTEQVARRHWLRQLSESQYGQEGLTSFISI